MHRDDQTASRAGRVTPAAVLTALLFTASPAFAAGMPQLDFANPLTIAQIVWGALIFLAFYLLLAHWALPQVGSVLAARAARIAEDLETARSAKHSADLAIIELTQARRHAQAESQSAIDQAVEAARAEAATRTAEADRRLEAQLAAAEVRIAEARAQAVGALRDVAADTTAVLIERLVGHAPDSGSVGRAVDGALARA